MRQTDLKWRGQIIRHGALLLLLAAIVLTHTGCTFHIYGQQSFGSYKDASRYSAGNFDYEAAGIREVEINWVDENITVTQSDADTLEVSETDKGLKENQKMHWLIDEDKLIIQYCSSGYKGRKMPSGTKKLSVEIPADVALTISTVSGDVTLTGQQTLRDLKINGVSSDVRAEDLTLSGKVEVNTVSGDCRLGLRDCDKASFESVSGNVVLTALPAGGARIDFQSASGDVHGSDYTRDDKKYVFGGGECKIDVSSVSGDLTVE